jgi:hypothetical protein
MNFGWGEGVAGTRRELGTGKRDEEKQGRGGTSNNKNVSRKGRRGLAKVAKEERATARAKKKGRGVVRGPSWWWVEVVIRW